MRISLLIGLKKVPNTDQIRIRQFLVCRQEASTPFPSGKRPGLSISKSNPWDRFLKSRHSPPNR